MNTLTLFVPPAARHVPGPGYRFPYLSVTITVMAILLIHAGPLLRWLDPTAAAIDIGAISLVLLAIFTITVFVAVSRWLLGLLWPVLRDYQRYHLTPNFKSLQPWQKIGFYFVVFFGLLYAFVYTLAAVF